MELLLLYGLIFGITIFLFSYALLKKTGNTFIAPLVTVVFGIAVIIYSIIGIGGFEGMGVGIIGLGLLLVSLVGTFLLFITKKIKRQPQKQYGLQDKIFLVLMPLLFVITIAWINASNEEYWVLEKDRIISDASILSFVNTIEENPEIRGYKQFTIGEGRKLLVVSLGEAEKQIEVDDVDISRGKTEVVVRVYEGDQVKVNSYILIGLDKINEPLTVKTTDGTVLEEL